MNLLNKWSLTIGAVAFLVLAGTLIPKTSYAEKGAASSQDPAIARTRQQIKMLDDLFKNAIVLIDQTYVKNPSDTSAAAAGKALFAAMKKSGWYEVRLLGLTDTIGDPDDLPKDNFEKSAALKLRPGGSQTIEEVIQKDGKGYLRMATGIPVVSEHCVMCHANFKGDKGNVGALSYIVPLIK